MVFVASKQPLVSNSKSQVGYKRRFLLLFCGCYWTLLKIFWHFSWVVFIGVLKVLLKNLHQWQQFGNFLRIGWWPVSFTTTSKLLHGRGHIIIRSAMNWKKEDRRPKQQLTHFFYLAWDRWQIIPMAILRAFILHGHQIGKLESFFTQTMLSKHTDLHLKMFLIP